MNRIRSRFSQWYGSIPTSGRASLQELAAGRQWMDRGIVLGYAAITGVITVAFTYLAEVASHLFAQITSRDMGGPYLALVLTPALTVLIVWWTRRFVPGALGSGIPQVVRALGEGCWQACRSVAKGRWFRLVLA
jgi:H+/Cl- antiporter ClcA